MLFERAFEHCHGGQRTGAHRDVWQFVGGTVSVDGEQVWPCRVHTPKNQMGTDVSLVPDVSVCPRC